MKRKIISVITTFVLILSSHFSMIYALDKPHLNLNEKEDSVEVTLNLPKVENGLDAFSGKIDYDQNKLELVKVKQVSKKLKTPEYNEKNGKFILLINSKTINESVDAVCFTFKVKKNVTGDTTVKVTKLTGSTSKNQKINLDDVQTVFTTDKKENNSNTGNTVLIVQIHLKTMVQKMIRINQIQPINQMILIKIVMGKTQVNKIRLVQMIV